MYPTKSAGSRLKGSAITGIITTGVIIVPAGRSIGISIRDDTKWAEKAVEAAMAMRAVEREEAKAMAGGNGNMIN